MAEAEAPPPSPVRSLRASAAVALALSEDAANVATDAVSISTVANVTVHGTGSVSVSVPQLKLPELSSTSSDSEGDDAQLQAENAVDSSVVAELGGRAASPPPNCAICLGRCKNKCFTDSCMHQFCFKCLCEWSKVKPECPLCKQTFKSIIHNVKSMNQFEMYHVQPASAQIPHRPLEVAYRSVPFFVDVVHGHNDYEISVANWTGPRAAHRIVRADRTLPVSGNAANDAIWNSTTGSRGVTGSTQNQLLRRGALLDMYRQEHSDEIPTSGTLSQQWRRYVYDRKLYAMPVCDITGRFRESNARFYRDNPAQVHRLMPWINRDVVVLLRNTDYDVTTVLECIKESLLMINILSPAFRRRLQPFLSTRTTHFIHELNNFARSPYDMIGYDRAVQYSTQGAEEIVIEFSSSGSSDEEGANVIDASNAPERVRNRNNYRVQSRASGSAAAQPPMVNLLSFTISTSSEGVEAPGVTVAVSGRGTQSTAINLTTHNRASEVIIDLEDTDMDVTLDNRNPVAAATVTSTSAAAAAADVGSSTATAAAALNTLVTPATVTENIELNSSSSDECEFVLERKPPHLRTPEMVSLNSESESDVVFVEEIKPLRNTTYISSDEMNANNAVPSTSKKSRAALVKQEHECYNVGASTSSGLRSSARERERKDRLSAAPNRSQYKQALGRRRNLRSSNSSVQTSRVARQDWTAKDAYSTDTSSASSDSDTERATQKRKRTRATAKSRGAAAKKRVTRNTEKGALELADNKRKKSQERESKSHKRFKRETHGSSNSSDDDDDEDDEGVNLKLLKNRLIAEKAQWRAERAVDSVQEAVGEAAVAGPVEHSNVESSCSNSSYNWPNATTATSTSAKTGSRVKRARQKRKHVRDEPNSAVAEARQNEADDAAEPARTSSSSLMSPAGTQNAAATPRHKQRTTSRTSTALSTTTHTSTSDSSASSTSSFSSSSSSASTPTTMLSSHSTSSAAEEESDSNAADAETAAHINDDFNLQPVVADMLNESQNSPQHGVKTENWRPSTDQTLTTDVEVPPPASPTTPVPLAGELEDDAVLAALLSDFQGDNLGLNMPIYSDIEREDGSTELDEDEGADADALL